MAIVKMSKFSLFAFDSERENLLHELQKFGYVHFDSLDDEELLSEGLDTVDMPESIGEVDEEISKVKYAIELLSKYDERETGIKSLIKGKENLTFEELEERASNFDYLPIYNQLRVLSSKLDGIDQETIKLNSLIEELSHWKGLNYPIKDLRNFKQCEVFMGTIPKKMKDKLNLDLLDLEYTYVELLNEDKDNIYLFALTLNDEKEKLNDILRRNGYSSIKLNIEGIPKEHIASIEEKIKSLNMEKQNIISQIKELSKHIANFEVSYEYLMNRKLRLAISENFLATSYVTVINGYVPTDMEDEFKKIVSSTLNDAYYLEVKEADADDPNVPILLKNSKFADAFDSLTSMFALPKYNEIDPTPLLAPFYLIFFGMMVADAGYGLLMLIATLAILKLVNLSESQRKFIKFFYYLSYPTIFWGLVFGSIFGGVVPMPALLNPAEQYTELLALSIILGLIHIFFALGIKAYMSIREKKYLDALYDVGFWYMALIGAIVALLPMIMEVNQTVRTVALVVMVIGMVGIVLTGGRDAKSIGGRLASGLYSLYGISSYIGDFVSYSRLMALGLSGGFIASAINMMVTMLFDLGFVGVIAGIIVFIGAQLFNVFLSLLGAYVHTIRLTYVEFFGKFYEGGGNEFNLFRSKSKYINLK